MKPTYFIDTFCLLAMINRADPAHLRAVDWTSQPGVSLVTSEFVLLEFADGVATTPARRIVQDLPERLRANGIEVVPLSRELFRRGAELYADRPDKGWSLTDCTSFHIMQSLGLTDALTADHHFEQAGFKALLR